MLSQKAKIVISNLNVRKSAGITAPIVKTAIPGVYNVLDKKDGWVKIGRNEWVMEKYVTLEDVEDKAVKIEIVEGVKSDNE